MHNTDTLVVEPLKDKPFGCVISLPSYCKNDPTALNKSDFEKLYNAVHENLVVVIQDQADLHPSTQYKLTKMFDSTIPEPKEDSGFAGYGHGKEFRHEQSVLKKDGTTVKSQPQVQILGQGVFEPEEPGNENGETISLTHPSHTTFHHTPLSAEKIKKDHETRFYRWHIDSALYDLNPPVVTTLLGIKVPPSNQLQKISYEDTGDELQLTQGATCFVSGEQAFANLSDEDKEFALNTTVEYAPHPYIFISPAGATSDGLTMVSEGKEIPFDKLPEWEESKIKKFPMVWKNPVTKKPHLQVHGCCLHKLHTKQPDGTVKTYELKEAREKAHKLMRPAIAPSYVLPHAWKQGDLVIFYNRGVWHSVTGEFKGVKSDGKDERRLMHQCNIASGMEPIQYS
ncbi:Piso0_001909 [Millerozyma farinosa CBS 7064]|uniref:Piso0_001909 protein n=1 Tax=Pichia sorbitophila (strain ATCC MYA-4447 / BCRC 22081 / CBS 7064 / NBRC 10061 / NRRL Y-12695) TaxID=559304 RepID=G8YM08_PICSO|nr:Piso0_001909 [Millerozyma farinosa CBS 7064]